MEVDGDKVTLAVKLFYWKVGDVILSMTMLDNDIVTLWVIEFFIEEYRCDGTILVTIEIEAFSLKISIDDEHAVELSCIWIVLGRL